MYDADVLTGAERRKGHIAVGCLVGVILLSWSGVCAAEIWNPSFESEWAIPVLPGPQWLPLYWDPVDHPSFSYECVDLWATDGAWSVCLYSRPGASFALDPDADSTYQSLAQEVDLTGMGIIMFDVALVADSGGDFDHFEASFLVDGVPLWSETVSGEYWDQAVDVSHLSDWHIIELRITAIDGGTFPASYRTLWDNLRLLEGPAIPTILEASVDLDPDLDPDTLNLACKGKWVTCYIELPEGYDATMIDGSTVFLEDIPAFVGWRGWTTPEANEDNITDLDGNGILERMVKFDRAKVEEIVQPGEVTLMVTGGLVDGTPFIGAATITVIDKGGKRKCGPSRPKAGGCWFDNHAPARQWHAFRWWGQDWKPVEKGGKRK